MGIILAFLAAVQAYAATPPLTHLGDQGNSQIVTTFNAYRAKPTHCRITSSGGRRVLLTGFGLFSGVDVNISGAVAESLASPDFISSTIDTKSAEVPAATKFLSGRLKAEDSGGRVYQREFNIDGQSVSACIVILDVLWDLAAAIIVHEMESFQPEVILLTGRGGETARFENSAQNLATMLSGYDSEGNSVSSNTPQALYVLPPGDRDVQPLIPMTWNHRQTLDSVADLLSKLGVLGEAPRTPRDDDYICNNVSFVAAHALRGGYVRLAGEQLVLPAKYMTPARLGFFHYPARNLNSDSAYLWSLALARMITVM